MWSSTWCTWQFECTNHMTMSTKKTNSKPRLFWNISKHTTSCKKIIKSLVEINKWCIPNFNEKWWEDITKEFVAQKEAMAKLLFKFHNTKLVETMFSSLDVNSDTTQLLWSTWINRGTKQRLITRMLFILCLLMQHIVLINIATIKIWVIFIIWRWSDASSILGDIVCFSFCKMSWKERIF